MNKFVSAVSLYVVETTKASIRDHKPPLPITPFSIAVHGFVELPFSKQLYNGVFSAVSLRRIEDLNVSSGM